MILLAQGTGDLIVVSETGEPFRFYLNGEWILEVPGTRAEVHDIHEGFHQGIVYIHPSEGRVIQLKKTFAVEEDYVEYYAIRKNRKGQYTISGYNRVLKEETPPAPPSATPPATSQPATPPSTVQPPTSPTQQNTQNQSTNIVFSPTIQIQTGGGGTQVSQQPSPTPGGGVGVPQVPVYTGPTYSGPCNCQQPMNREAFQKALSTVQSQNFDNLRLDIAKQIARSNCLLASDVKALTRAFQFENYRLEFAKFAYDYTLDLSNYFEVAEAFDFEPTRSELMDYIRGRGARYRCQGVPLGSVVGGVSMGSPVPVTSAPQAPANAGGAATSSAGCQPCMSVESFANALSAIRGAASGLSRLEMAKALLTANCLSAAQVRDICKVLVSEPDRLDFAKQAYRRCCDPQNYLVVSSAFSSTASQEELARFIQSVNGR